jgi:phage-related protein
MNTLNDSKELVLFYGEIKTPPFSKSARTETGFLLRKLQEGELLSLPESRPMPNIGKHCHELRVGDREYNIEWRIIYRIDEEEIVIFDIFQKTTQKTPKQIIDNCQKRINRYDEMLGTG